MIIVSFTFIIAVLLTWAYVKNKDRYGCLFYIFTASWLALALVVLSLVMKDSNHQRIIVRYEKVKVFDSQVQTIERVGQIWKEDPSYSLEGLVRESKLGLNSEILKHRRYLNSWLLKDWGSKEIAELELFEIK